MSYFENMGKASLTNDDLATMISLPRPIAFMKDSNMYYDYLGVKIFVHDQDILMFSKFQ